MIERLSALWARVLSWYASYSERDRRIILGVVVATVASLVYLGVLQPIIDYRRSIAQEIAEQQEALERSMRFLGAKDTLRAEREDLRKRLAQAKQRLLPGGTGTLGAAALQERANALAQEKGITVQSTQVLKDEAADPFRKVGIRLTLLGELKPLAELIAGLELGQQLTLGFVEVSRRGAVAAAAKGPRTLTSTVEVSGFVQEGAKGEKADATAAGDGAPGAEGAEASTPGEGAVSPEAGEATTTTTTTTTLGSTTTLASVSTTLSSPTTLPSTTLPPPTLPPVAEPPQALQQPSEAQPRVHIPGPDIDEMGEEE